MLKFIRRNATSTWVKVIFGAIVLVFVFFGVGAVQDTPPMVAVVNDEGVTPVDYVRSYNNLVRTYQEIFKENFGPEQAAMLNLKTRALEQLVTSTLLRQEAERLGLNVGAEEVRDAIVSIPAFQVDGRFNRDLYLRVMRINRMTPGDFEAAQRRELLVDKIRDLIAAGVYVDEASVRERFVRQNEEVTLRFLRFDGRAFEPEVSVTDEEIGLHFEEHAEDFNLPERARVEYVLYSSNRFMDRAEPSEEAIRAYYEENADDYALPERVRVRHILLQANPDIDDALKEEVRKKAEEVLAKLNGGEEFAALARQYSEDAASADNGGDLGLLTRGRMGDDFDAVAFSLDAGATSEVVETPLGFNVIRVDEKIAAGPDDLANVRGEILLQLKREMARDLANVRANEDYEKVAGGQDLAAVAATGEFEVVTPEPFARTEDISGLGRNSPLANAAFSVGAGELGPVVAGPDGFFVFRVKEKIAAHTPELAAVRSRVESAVRTRKALELAGTKAAEGLQKLKEGADVRAVADEYGLSVQETGAFSRAGTYVPNMGNLPALKDAAFSLTTESPTAPEVYETDGAQFVAVLAERVAIDEQEFQAQKDELTDQMRRQQQVQVLEQFVDYLQARAEIERNEAYLASVPDTGRPLPDPRY